MIEIAMEFRGKNKDFKKRLDLMDDTIRWFGDMPASKEARMRKLEADGHHGNCDCSFDPPKYGVS